MENTKKKKKKNKKRETIFILKRKTTPNQEKIGSDLSLEGKMVVTVSDQKYLRSLFQHAKKRKNCNKGNN